MIYAILPYYPREGNLDNLLECLKRQSEEYVLVVVDAYGRSFPNKTLVITKNRRMYFTESIRYAQKFLSFMYEDDIVCVLNDDLIIPDNYFNIGKNVKSGEVFLPMVYEDGLLVDGGIDVDWSSKYFYLAESNSIKYFSPRGIFMTAKDFSKIKFNRILPHYLSDYNWSGRLIRNGINPVRICRIDMVRHDRETKIFSKLNPANPFYWTIFLLLNGKNRYFLENLIKVWLHPFIKRH